MFNSLEILHVQQTENIFTEIMQTVNLCFQIQISGIILNIYKFRPTTRIMILNKNIDIMCHK